MVNSNMHHNREPRAAGCKHAAMTWQRKKERTNEKKKKRIPTTSCSWLFSSYSLINPMFVFEVTAFKSNCILEKKKKNPPCCAYSCRQATCTWAGLDMMWVAPGRCRSSSTPDCLKIRSHSRSAHMLWFPYPVSTWMAVDGIKNAVWDPLKYTQVYTTFIEDRHKSVNGEKSYIDWYGLLISWQIVIMYSGYIRKRKYRKQKLK